jgi:hypothetical protein
MNDFNELQKAMQEYADHLTADYGTGAQEFNVNFYEGAKFIKVAVGNKYSYSAHSFIVIKPDGKFKFGDILKAASWKAPAKNFARGNMLDRTFKSIRWCGV